jgi:hypothetical protein
VCPRQASSKAQIDHEKCSLATEQKRRQEIVSGFLKQTLEWKDSEKEYQDTISRLREEVSSSQKSWVTSEKEVARISVKLANLETEKAGLSHTVNALLQSATWANVGFCD